MDVEIELDLKDLHSKAHRLVSCMHEAEKKYPKKCFDGVSHRGNWCCWYSDLWFVTPVVRLFHWTTVWHINSCSVAFVYLTIDTGPPQVTFKRMFKPELGSDSYFGALRRFFSWVEAIVLRCISSYIQHVASIPHQTPALKLPRSECSTDEKC